MSDTIAQVVLIARVIWIVLGFLCLGFALLLLGSLLMELFRPQNLNPRMTGEDDLDADGEAVILPFVVPPSGGIVRKDFLRKRSHHAPRDEPSVLSLSTPSKTFTPF